MRVYQVQLSIATEDDWNDKDVLDFLRARLLPAPESVVINLAEINRDKELEEEQDGLPN